VHRCALGAHKPILKRFVAARGRFGARIDRFVAYRPMALG